MNYNFMEIAILEATVSYNVGEIAVGAVIVDRESGTVICQYGNRCKSNLDITAHAEILCIRKAQLLYSTDCLNQFDIYVTLEPCAMCRTAISYVNMGRVFFGAYIVDKCISQSNKSANYENNHNKLFPTDYYGGIMEQKCKELLISSLRRLR